MNKEEIEEIKRLLFQDRLTQYGKRKLVQYLEQKESILDKVTDKLKEDTQKFNRLRKKHKMYSISEERLLTKYFYALKLLNIIEGEKK